MELTDRKIRILELIINDYIVTAEPIGSRTIAKKFDLGVSSATVRNEMSDLEEMGYILAPHASAGRTPTDKGYRLYVDRLMRHKALGGDEMQFLQRIIADNINQIDYLMRETARAIALLTNYTTVVSEAVSDEERLQHLQFVPLDETSVVLVTVTSSKKVKNHIIRVNPAPGGDMLGVLSAALNAALSGKCARKISVSEGLAESFNEYKSLLAQTIAAVAAVLGDGSDTRVYTSGMRNILTYPEFADLEKARAIFETLEEKDYLVTLLGSVREEGVDIVIGHENSVTRLRDCSVIKTSYTLGGQVHGSIGILGPTRMDYPQAVAVLNSILDAINGAIKSLEDKT